MMQLQKEPRLKMHPTKKYLSDDIAVIGMACRFPGADNYQQYWQNLVEGISSIVEIPSERWSINDYYKNGEVNRHENKACSKWAGLIDNIAFFDADFFQISAREAESMDPQQRLLLQEAWHCIEDAGIPLAILQKNKTSVFAGVMAVDYQHHAANLDFPIDSYACLGNYAGIIANRVSHCFKFSGESKTIDTACSSSLVALHDARRSLLGGQSDYGLVAGVNIICHPWKYISFSKSHMLSPEGQCKTFDMQANGYVPGEGIGVLLLCSLSRAKEMGHHIYGIIKSCTVNHNAGNSAITAPDVATQVQLVQQAIQEANIRPEEISYVEMHGTGTTLGDPIEVEALVNIIQDTAHSCSVGSVKTNIGHLEAAAGVAGVIKVLLMLKYQCLVPTINLTNENPLIDFSQLPLKPVLKTQAWQNSKGLRTAGISSLGFGGVNAHCIITEYPPETGVELTELLSAYPFLISAKSAVSLSKIAKAFLQFIQSSEVNLADLSFALMNRSQFNYRFSLYVRNLSELKEGLSNFVKASKENNVVKSNTFYHFIFTETSNFNLVDFKKLCDSLPLLKRNYKEVIDTLKSYKNELKQNLSSMTVSGWQYAYAKFLIQVGIVPEYIVINKQSLLVACLLTEVIDFNQAVALVEGEEISVSLKIPHIRLVLEDSNKTYELINAETINKLLTQINLDEDIWVKLIATCRKLFNHQLTFKRYINEYAQIIILYKIDIIDILQKETNATFANEEKLIIALCLTAALYKLNKKWGLAQKIQLNSKAFECVSEGLAEDIFTLSSIIAKILNLVTESDEKILVEINKRIFNKKAFLLVEKICKATQSGYRVATLDELYNHFVDKAQLNLPLNTSCININEQSIVYENTIRLLINVWQHGYLINWHETFQTPCFKPFTLPSYVFDTKRFWLNQENASQPSACENFNKIAIIGFSGCFPGANNCEELWQKLTEGYTGVTEIPESRWHIKKFYHPDKNEVNKSYSKWGGFLTDIETFDASFFNILPDDALLMDPQQRLVLEEAWNALEASGYTGGRLNKQQCGIYVGVMNNDYYEKILRTDARHINASEYIGNHNSILASRIAYFLDLKGPAIALDTACSSSLVGIHLACEAINSGNADMMLAGGVTLYLSETPYISMSKANMLSPEGRCKTFDDQANGFVPAEGIGFVVLKRLKQAIDDGDHIYAVIEGSGINQDGRSNGITAPNLESQRDLLISIYKKYNISPDRISYVEAHGTGTKLGDPVEVSALTQAFSAFTSKKQFCAIGSIKSNIGHTSAASGVIGLIKLLLCLQHKKWVPSINYHKENQHLHLSETPFYVNTSYQEWPLNENMLRMAAISAFGFSGTNSHLVLSEYLSVAKSQQLPSSISSYPIPISAKSETALQNYSKKLLAWLRTNNTISLANLSFTLCYGRAQFKKRLLFWVSSIENLIDTLASVTDYTAEHQIINWDYLPLHLQSLSINYLNQQEEVQWDIFFTQKTDLNIIYLPTYCFDKRKFYIDSNINALTRDQDNSLIKEVNLTLSAHEVFIKEHVVNGQKILPAACIIDMVLTQALEVKDVFPVVLENLQLHQPIVSHSEENITIKIKFIRLKNNAYAVEFYYQKNEHWLKAASLELILKEHKQYKPFALSKHLKKAISHKELYNKLEELGLYYGKSFRLIQEVKHNDVELLAKLDIQPIDTQLNYTILPTLLDAAFHSVIAVGDYPATFLPYSINSIVVYSQLKESTYVYAKLLRSTDYEKLFDIYILDSQGNVSLEISSLHLHLSTKQLKQNKNKTNGLHIYQPFWYKTMKVDHLFEEFCSHDPQQVLFFLPNEEKIKENNHFHCVVNGEVFQDNTVTRQVINFNLEEHYHKFFDLLCQRQVMPSNIIIVWHTDANLSMQQWDMEIVNRYLLCPLYIVKAVMKKNKLQRPIQLHLVLYGNTTQNSLLFESLGAAIKTINLETNKIHAKLLHFYSNNSNKMNLASIWEHVKFESKRIATQVIYRGSERYIKNYQKLADFNHSNMLSAFRKGGVYVISGGSGGLGLLLAQYLSDKYQAKTILVGRSSLNDEKTKLLDAFNKDNANIFYLKADITQEQEVTNVLSQVRTQWGAINGIIHCAGITKDNFMRNKTVDDINKVISPKILGVINLDHATRQDKLDVFILFSSLAGNFGNIGQYDYAYANAFLHNYAQYRNLLVKTGGCFGKTLSIGWPYWEANGMKLNEESKQWLNQQFGINTITADEGLGALEYLMAFLQDDCLIARGDQTLIEKKLIVEEPV